MIAAKKRRTIVYDRAERMTTDFKQDTSEEGLSIISKRSIALKSKKFKHTEIAFDSQRPDLIAKFREIDPSMRIRDREAFAKHLMKFYPKTLAENISGYFFKNYFGDFSSVKIDEFYRSL